MLANRPQKPVAPLSGDYTALGPPRFITPGTKTAKEKAGHVVLALLCSVGFVWLWTALEAHHLDRCFGMALVPLGAGVLWGLIPLGHDWIILIHQARHSHTYLTIHLANSEELRAVSEEWSGKHNGTHSSRQAIDLVKRAREEELEAANARLMERLTKLQQARYDQTTEHLEY